MFCYNQKYIDGLTKTYGFHKEYQFNGKKCSKDCKPLINYETIHSKECPFYEGSFSQKFDYFKQIYIDRLDQENAELKDQIRTMNDFLKFHTPDDRLVVKDFEKFCELRNKYVNYFKKR